MTVITCILYLLQSSFFWVWFVLLPKRVVGKEKKEKKDAC